MKRFSAIFICIVMLFASGFCANAEDDTASLTPLALVQFSSIESSALSFFVSDGGKATVQYSVFLKNDAGPVVVKTYIEKKNTGLFWSRVENGMKNNEWTDRYEKKYFVGTHTLKLSESGTYRAMIEIYVGSDVLKKYTEFQYDVNGLRGDVDSDGRITASDARLALRFSAKLQQSTQSQKKNADMNDDGRITAADARLILRMAARL